MRQYLGLAAVMLVVAAVAGCEKAQSQTAAGGAPGGGPPKMPPAVVYVAKPEVMQVTDFEDFTGHTEAVNKITISAEVTGYLEKVNFIDGQHVRSGEVLFEIDPRLFQADFNSKNALLAQAQTQVARTKADLERAQNTFASKAISQEQFDQYRFAYLEAVAAVNSAQAILEVSRANLSYTKVTTLISGKVGKRQVDPGNLVIGTGSTPTVLTTVVSEDPIYATFDVDERTLLRFRHLKEAGKFPEDGKIGGVKLSLADETAFPEDRVGKINFEDNQINPQSATIQWRAEFPNPKGLLTLGMFIRVRVPIGDPHKAIVVPESALGADQGRKFVYVVNDNKVEYRTVTIGIEVAGGKRAIDSGLKEGETFIVTGLQRVRPDADVIPKPYEDPAKTAAKSGATMGAKPDASHSAPAAPQSKPNTRPMTPQSDAPAREPIRKPAEAGSRFDSPSPTVPKPNSSDTRSTGTSP